LPYEQLQNDPQNKIKVADVHARPIDDLNMTFEKRILS